MKTLILMRHAKSDHGDAGLADHDRPLNDRGIRSAPQMAERMKASHLLPDAIVSSTALRARETARLVAESLEFAAPIDKRRALYLTAPRAYIDEVRSLPDDWSRVLIVGHNPTIESLVNLWTDEEHEFPTAGVAAWRWDIQSWRDVSLDSRPELLALWRP